MKYRLPSILFAGATALIFCPLAHSQTENPNAESQRDRSEKVKPDSRKLRDSNPEANPDSEKLVDSDGKANPESVELEETDREATPDAEPLRDSDELANPDAGSPEDPEQTANPDPERLRDSKRKANRDSEAPEDSDGGENAEAAEARDTDRKSNPVSEEPQEKTPGDLGGAEEAVEDRNERIREARKKAVKQKKEARSETGDVADKRLRKREEKISRIRRESEPVGEAVVPELPEGVDIKVVEKAESGVKEATALVERQLEEQKLEIKDEKQAKEMISEVLGAEGRLSRAERSRDDQMGIRRNFRNRGAEGNRQREDAVRFLSQRLMGEAELRNAPKFFRTPQPSIQGIPRDARAADMIVRQPRYYHEGRRYLPYSSRSEIPAILLATAALDRIRIQPMREVAPVFRGIPHYESNIPSEYRSEESHVLSYPVNANTMISSNDILFRQGSTAFADEHSYEMLAALEETMKRSELRDETFVIEGHASAEGSFENNLVLSQHRAEAIVRDLVRSGIDPSRLVPVGYGEAEAESPADAAEQVRRLDRRVVVVRLNEKSIAGR